LAAANAAAYEPDLAMSLNNLSIRLAEAGRREEGLGASEEAVAVRRRLASANAAAYEPDLARSLNNLSIGLAEAGRRNEAERARSGAVEVEESVNRRRDGTSAYAEADPTSASTNVGGTGLQPGGCGSTNKETPLTCVTGRCGTTKRHVKTAY